MKHCPSCKTEKSLSEFGVDRRAKNGVAVYCKPCNRAKSQRQRDRDPDHNRRMHLKHRYSMTLEDAADMLMKQNFSCAICKTDEVDLVIDHCHSTNKVRGMLCNNCNTGLGQFKDNITFLENAISYLNEK